jgi:hypothetical protein
MYHYIYSITYTDVPNIYYGVRSCHCRPSQDLDYWGSPVTFKEFMEAHKATRVKTILATYPTREAAEIAEDIIIEKQWEVDKPLSLNANFGRGGKFNNIGKPSTPRQKRSMAEVNRRKEHIEAVAAAKSRNYYLVSPSGEVFEGRNISEFCRNKKLCQVNITDVINGGKFHYKGWTASIELHQLYIEYYKNRGFYWDNKNRTWIVNWNENKIKLTKRFKSEDDAIAYRDYLISSGYNFRINPKVADWKKRLANMQLAA